MSTPSGTGPVVDAKTTESLSQELAEAFNGFDSRMQRLTANLDPDNVRTAGAIALEVGMYANSQAKVLSDLIGLVEVLTAQVVSSAAEPG